jgi:hypothetical protein
MNIQQDTKNTDIHIYSIDLVVMYSMYGQLVQLSDGTGECTTPTISIVDRDFDDKEMSVTIQLTKLEELNLIIKDFKDKLNKLKR